MLRNIANRLTLTIAFFVLAAIYFVVNLGMDMPILAGALKLAPTLSIFVSVLIIRYGLRDPFVTQYKTQIPYSIVIAVGSSIVGDLAGEFKPVYGTSALLFQIFFFAIAQIFYAVSFMNFCGRKKVGTVQIWEYVVKFLVLGLLFCYLIVIAITVFMEVEDTVVCVAIFVYMILISIMATLSIIQKRPDQAWFVVGAILFCVSDSIIAVNTFVRPVPNASLLIMSTYFLAQYCLNIRLFPKK